MNTVYSLVPNRREAGEGGIRINGCGEGGRKMAGVSFNSRDGVEEILFDTLNRIQRN